MTGRWFRFYDSVVDDPKVQRLPDQAFRAWVNLMCVASKNDGKISTDLQNVAFALRVNLNKARDVLQILQSAGLIERFETGWQPHNWSTRQYASDSSAERMRRLRAKVVTPDVTVDVTSHVQNSDAVDSEQNRTEQKETMSADADGVVPIPKPKAQENRYPADFEQFWTAYGRRENSPKPKAFKAWKRTASIRPPLPELLRCVASYLSFLAIESKKRRAEFPKKHHVTWLNDNSWEAHMIAPSPVLSLEDKRARDAERAATETWEAELEAARIRQGA